jgi:hypothetical protein
LEQEKIAAELQQLHAFGDKLGSALAATFNLDRVQGGGWSHHSGHAHYVALNLVHPSGMGIWLRHGGGYRKGRAGRMLTVGGNYPRGHGGWQAEKIRVWMDRDPADMARDIIRRLLPDYLATIDHALEQAREEEVRRRARIMMNRVLEQTLPDVHAIGGTPARESRDRSRSFWSGGRLAHETRRPALGSGATAENLEPQGPEPALVSGHATLSGDATTMDLELKDVPAELALRVLALINPTPALEGKLVPRAVTPETPALPAAPRVVPGEVLAETAGELTESGAA